MLAVGKTRLCRKLAHGESKVWAAMSAARGQAIICLHVWFIKGAGVGLNWNHKNFNQNTIGYPAAAMKIPDFAENWRVGEKSLGSNLSSHRASHSFGAMSDWSRVVA